MDIGIPSNGSAERRSDRKPFPLFVEFIKPLAVNAERRVVLLFARHIDIGPDQHDRPRREADEERHPSGDSDCLILSLIDLPMEGLAGRLM